VPLLIALVAVVLIWLMPDIETQPMETGPRPEEAYRAVVIDPLPSPDLAAPDSGYNEAIIEYLEGPREGQEARVHVALFTGTVTTNDLKPGDEVVVTISDDFSGGEFVALNEPYRLPVLGLLVLLFALTMILVGGWQGLRALLALGLTIVLVIKLFVPLILEGVPPVPLAVGLATIVTVTTVLLTEGWTRVGAVAIAGTVGGLLITAALAGLTVGAASFGELLVGQIAYFEMPSGELLDGGAVLLAAIILGAVGVLDDVTVTQAATVEEFAHKSQYGPGALWRRGMRVGRSHIAATTNTLFMAYVGASLPAIVFIIAVAEPPALTLNRETLGLEVVRTLVGSIGIVLAMPLTTFVAAWAFRARQP
jgi:uncharacterized membrane protein